MPMLLRISRYMVLKHLCPQIMGDNISIAIVYVSLSSNDAIYNDKLSSRLCAD